MVLKTPSPLINNRFSTLQLMSLRGTKRPNTDSVEQPPRTAAPPPLISDKGMEYIRKLIIIYFSMHDDLYSLILLN